MNSLEDILKLAALFGGIEAGSQNPQAPKAEGEASTETKKPKIVPHGPNGFSINMGELQEFASRTTDEDFATFLEEAILGLIKGAEGEPQGVPTMEDIFSDIFGNQQPESVNTGPTPTLGDILASIQAQTASTTDKAPAEPVAEKKKRYSTPIETDDNGVALKAAGLSIMHFHPDTTSKGEGMTICFRDLSTQIRTQRVVEVATAIVHPEDTFTKKKGTEVALKNFLNGHTINLPVIAGLSVVETLKSYFWSHSDKLTRECMEEMGNYFSAHRI